MKRIFKSITPKLIKGKGKAAFQGETALYNIPAKEEAAGSAGMVGVGSGGTTAIGLGEGQSLIPSPVWRKRAKKKKKIASEEVDNEVATEAYLNDGTFDEDQELMLQIVKEDGHDVSDYVTPDNSPEQIFELGESVGLGIPPQKIALMADPGVSFMAIQVVNKAWKKRIDLTKYLPWADPFVLNQAILGAQKGINPDLFIKRGYDHRQIEQMRKELEAGGDSSKLHGDYNKMRAQRFPESNISNVRNPIPKGRGTSGKKKGGKN